MRARVYVHPAPLRADSWNWSKYSAVRSSRYFCGFISGMARAGREAPRGRSLLTAPSPVTAAARDPTNGGDGGARGATWGGGGGRGGGGEAVRGGKPGSGRAGGRTPAASRPVARWERSISYSPTR